MFVTAKLLGMMKFKPTKRNSFLCADSGRFSLIFLTFRHKKAPKFWRRTGRSKQALLIHCCSTAKDNGVIMEQNIMVSQISNNHRNLIKGLIRKQKVKRIKNALRNKRNQLIAAIKDAYKNSPALGFGTCFIGGIVVLVVTMSFALASAHMAYKNLYHNK